jgi:hypothetical protein
LLGYLADHLFRQRHHLLIICIRPVEFQHSEFWVMPAASLTATEAMAQLEEPQWQAEGDELSGGLAEVAPWGASVSSGARGSPLGCCCERKVCAVVSRD